MSNLLKLTTIKFLFSLLIAIAFALPAFAVSLDGFDPKANSTLRAITVQGDGKILIGGYFTTVYGTGAPSATTRNRIARLNADGTLDTSFAPSADGAVHSIAVQGNGQILIGGDFLNIGGVARNRIARLNADGTLDTSFNPGADGSVRSIAVQGDGKIIIGGLFLHIGTTLRNRIARVDSGGALDAFDPNAGSDVYSIAVQGDGKILIGGLFTTVYGTGAASPTTRTRIARLNTDGTLDAFNINVNENYVHSIAVQPADGKIIIGGSFLNVGGAAHNRIARLNADGTVDASLSLNANSDVYSVAVQADGKILAGGLFTNLGGARNYVARLNADGTLDASFTPSASNYLIPIAVQGDGKILIGGDFTTVGGTARNRVARLSETVQWTAASQASANESGTMTVTAQISSTLGVDVTVPYTVTGTATGGGTDYTITSSPITITAGSTTGTATITITPDTIYEGNETVILTMGTPTNAIAGAPTVHTATITDDDAAPLPTVQWTAASQASANESGTMTVTAQLSAAYGSTVTVPFTVTGTATGGGTDYTITASPITITAGSTTGTATITITPDALIESNETVILTMGAPTNATLGATTVHTATITDDDAMLPTVQWTAASQASANESGTMTVTAQLSAVSGVDVTVPYTVTGTATGGGTDYTITSSPIIIPAGSTTGTATITIASDTLYEGNETVILTMGTPTNANPGVTTVHTATITDDDTMSTVQWISASQASANESGTMTVTAQLSAVSGVDVTVPYTVTGTATGGGTDYTITASPITITAGSTTGTATITIASDTLYEGNETVILTMGAPTNATAGATTVHTATITDDDAAPLPTVQWTAASQTSANESGTMTVTAQLSAVSGVDVTVPYTVTGTATGGGTDYTITASPITITAGSTTGTATITITPDTLVESNETVILTMGTPTNATLGATTVHTATITDDDAIPMPAYAFLQYITVTSPNYLAVDKDENLYVVDSTDKRLNIYDRHGNYLRALTGFSSPGGVAVDKNGMIYIGDYGTGKKNVGVYRQDLTLSHMLGIGNGEFNVPGAIAVSSAGIIYVADITANKIKLYNPDGSYSSSFGSGSYPNPTGNGQFNKPQSIAINETAGELIIVDLQLIPNPDNPSTTMQGARVQIFDMNGVFKRSFGDWGQGEGKIDKPYGVAIDSQYRIYVTDAGQNVVQVFDSIGRYRGTIYDIIKPMRTPIGIALGVSNRLFVASLIANRVDVYGIDTYSRMDVAPLSLDFAGVEGGPAPASQSISITNNGNGTLNWTASSNASWITLSAPSGSAGPGIVSTLNVSINLSGLSGGTYSGSVAVTAAETGITDVVNVTLTLQSAPAVLSVAPLSVAFISEPGVTPPAQAISISNTGGGVLNWTASSDSAWILINKNAGTAPDAISVSVDITGLAEGIHTGSVSVTGAETTVTIPVTFNIDSVPVADFTASPTSGSAPLTVNFTNSSTGYDQPLTYEWDFNNDGIVDSTFTNPSYEYTAEGTYSVKLKVTDSDGSTSSLTMLNYISVTSSLSPIMIVGAANSYFNSLQSAYDAAVNLDIILVQQGTFTENILFNTNKTITLIGGYNSDFTAVSGRTFIYGNATISDGVVTMENVAFNR